MLRMKMSSAWRHSARELMARGSSEPMSPRVRAAFWRTSGLESFRAINKAGARRRRGLFDEAKGHGGVGAKDGMVVVQGIDQGGHGRRADLAEGKSGAGGRAERTGDLLAAHGANERGNSGRAASRMAPSA